MLAELPADLCLLLPALSFIVQLYQTGLHPPDASLLHIRNLTIGIHYLDVSYIALYIALCKTLLYVQLDLICSHPDQLGLQEEACSHFASVYKRFFRGRVSLVR